MHALDPQTFRPVTVADIKPGDIFYIYETGALIPAVGIDVHDENKRVWLRLAGPKAFLFDEARNTNAKMVLRLPLEAQRVRLRVDFSCLSTSDESQHHIGQVATDQSDGVWIHGAWPQSDMDARREYRQGARLAGWQYGANYQPRLRFDRWALSYIDDAGEWITIAAREPELGGNGA
jgi:hypothetical protein